MPRTVDSYLHLPRRRYFSALELHAALIGTVAAAVVTIGYGFSFEPMQRLVPEFPTMKLRTAVVLMALSLSYLLSLRDNTRARWGSIGIASVVLVILIETALVRPAEQFPELPWTVVPSYATVFCLAVAAVSLLVVNIAPQWSAAISALTFLALTPALFRIFTLLLFRGVPDENSPLNTMALHTAVLCCWLLLICLLHPRLGSSRILLQASLRGRLLRRALPVVVVLPVGLAALSLGLSVFFGWPSEGLLALNAAISVTAAAALVSSLATLVADWQQEANDRASLLTRANEALERYASSAAHDLKAPARHVLLYGELLEEALARGDVATARKHAKSIRDSAMELPTLIDGILDYSRSAHTRITLSENSLSELVQAAAEQNAVDLKAAGANIRVLTEARLRCDSTLMTSVFQNLIANAIKSRRRDRPLEVQIDCQRDGGFWIISVEDNGVGFNPEFAAVAFNPLARGVHTAGEGEGIGLSTCRNIVQSHGGRIWIDPEYRGGARIVFTLPEGHAVKG